MLKQAGGILNDSARATDFVARFGGEEFIVLLPNTAGRDAAVVAEKIRKIVADADISTVGRVTFSIGVATAGVDDPDPSHAVRMADAALYQAKAEGRNRVCASAAG